eukprot:6814948-Pyramimonas_sp.AAC.1
MRPRIVSASRHGTASSLKEARHSAIASSDLAKGAASRPDSPSTSAPMRSTRSCLQRAFSAE